MLSSAVRRSVYVINIHEGKLFMTRYKISCVISFFSSLPHKVWNVLQVAVMGTRLTSHHNLKNKTKIKNIELETNDVNR